MGGNDTPLAVLSERPQSLFHYFKQLFAQVTNPPIDAYREQLVTSTLTWLGGAEGDILHPSKKKAIRIRLESPILSSDQLEKLEGQSIKGLHAKVIDSVYQHNMEDRLQEIFHEAKNAIQSGINLIVLSDKATDANHIAIPTLLVVSGLHQYLIREGLRTKASIIAQTGEAREVHHFAAMLGYGVDAIHPYLVYQTLNVAVQNQDLPMTFAEAQQNLSML